MTAKTVRVGTVVLVAVIAVMHYGNTTKPTEGEKVFKTRPHPETHSGEVWLTNSQVKSLTEIGWKSARVGQYAYAKDGGLVQPYPVFVQRKELEAAGYEVVMEEGVTPPKA